MGTLPPELVGSFRAESVVLSCSWTGYNRNTMKHCAFCFSLDSGYDDGHWEDCGENLLLCRGCVEQVARALIEEGKGELVNERLRGRLEKKAGIRERVAEAKEKAAGDCFNIANDSDALEALAENQIQD